MTDFSKTKITFALALVGVLFALHPIIKDIGNWGYFFFSYKITLEKAYYAFSLLLALSVYIYALDFLQDRPIVIAQKVGNLFYAVGLFIPPLFFLFWLSTKISILIEKVSNSEYAGSIVEVVLGILVGALSSIVFEKIRKTLNNQDKESNINALSSKELNLLIRARKLLEEHYYDLSIVESFKAFQVALDMVFLNKSISIPMKSPMQVLEYAHSKGILTDEQMNNAQTLRVARNDSTHSKKEFGKDEAEKMIKLSEELIKTLSIA